MATETFYTESGNSPPRKTHGFQLKFTHWSQPMQAVTDHYEEIILGFRITSRGVVDMAVSGREIPA